jgi:surface antigen
MSRIISLISILGLLAACAYPVGPREGSGTLIGAGTGALIGSQFGSGEGRLVGAAIGTLAGALIGQDVGRTLDQADQLVAQRSAQAALETGPSRKTATWVNPDTGNRGSITPTRTFQSKDGRYCREYQQTIKVGGEKQHAYGTACRQADGSWQISAAQPPAPTVKRRALAWERGLDDDLYSDYRPVYFWPFFTSLSLSFGHFSGHHGGWGHHHGHWDD